MVARAETRALKRAIELKAGLPFVNILIETLFQTDRVSNADDGPGGARVERDVSNSDIRKRSGAKSQYSSQAKEYGRRIRRTIGDNVKKGLLSEERGRYWWNKVLLSMGKNQIKLLQAHETAIIREIETGEEVEDA